MIYADLAKILITYAVTKQWGGNERTTMHMSVLVAQDFLWAASVEDGRIKCLAATDARAAFKWQRGNVAAGVVVKFIAAFVVLANRASIFWDNEPNACCYAAFADVVKEFLVFL